MYENQYFSIAKLCNDKKILVADIGKPLSMATETFWSPQKGGVSYVSGKPLLKVFRKHVTCSTRAF
jgi:hypothetical protein